MKKQIWYKAYVIKGNKLGEKIGFPTVNLKTTSLMKDKKEGVYLVKVKIDETVYNGLLYFGPRLVLKESKKILEIFIIGFNERIYGKEISFSLGNYIREAKFFPDLDSLRKQIQKDLKKAEKFL